MALPPARPHAQKSVRLGVVLLAAGCANPFAPGRSIVLSVENIEAPATAAPGAGFSVTFRVVSGGCKRFVRGEATKTSTTLTFTAQGRDGSGPNIFCTDDIRYDDVVEVVTPPISDPFTIVAKQPDGSQSTKVVRVQ